MVSAILRGVAGSPGSSVTATSVFTTPAGVVAGDILLVLMAESLTGINWDTSIPAGWSHTAAITTTASMELFWIQLAGAPAATYTFTASVAHVQAGIMIGYGNVIGFDPTPTVSGQINAASTTITPPSITLTNANDQLVWLAFTNSAAGNNTPPVITVPIGNSFTQQGTQVNSTTSTNANVGLAVADLPSAGFLGATGAITGSDGAARINGAVLVGLKVGILPKTSVTAPGMQDALEPNITAVGQAMSIANTW